ncbi:hypothetical protein ACWDA3_51320 [Nonomuraea rubra]
MAAEREVRQTLRSLAENLIRTLRETHQTQRESWQKLDRTLKNYVAKNGRFPQEESHGLFRRYAYNLYAAKRIYSLWNYYGSNPEHLETEEKEALKRKFRRIAVARGAHQARIKRFSRALTYLILASYVGTGITASAVIYDADSRACIVLALLAIVILDLWAVILSRNLRYLILVAPFTFVALLAEWQLGSPILSRPDVALQLAAMWSMLCIFFTLCGAVIIILQSRISRNKRDPEGEVVYHLLLALKILSSARVTSLKSRRKVVILLEHAAYWLKVGVPRSFGQFSSGVEAALVDQCRGAANAIQGYQRAVIVRGNEARDEVQNEIKTLIEALLEGVYSQLPIAAAEESNKVARPPFRRTALNAIRTLIVASVPFGCLEVTQLMGWTLSEGMRDAAIIFSAAWAAVAIIGLLDPLYKNKLGAIQEFMNAIRGP